MDSKVSRPAIRLEMKVYELWRAGGKEGIEKLSLIERCGDVTDSIFRWGRERLGLPILSAAQSKLNKPRG